MVNIKPLISIVTNNHFSDQLPRPSPASCRVAFSASLWAPLAAASAPPWPSARANWTWQARRKKFGAVEGRSWATKNGDNSEKLKTWTKDGLDDLSQKHPRILGYMQFWSLISVIQLGIYLRKTWLLVIKFGLLLIRIGLLLIELGIWLIKLDKTWELMAVDHENLGLNW